MITLEQAYEGYLDCRRRKRGTVGAIEFEMNYESKLIDLVARINSRSYLPGVSICFVVLHPKPREIFAADFEDRIVHHIVSGSLNPLFESVFNDRTFNCRVGKGQLYGVSQLKRDMYDCSAGYTKDCWTAKFDLKGFFMSINKRLLLDMLDKFIVERYDGEDKEDIRYLCRVLIEHEPQKNCSLHSEAALWELIPAHKSLFTNKEGYGLAIGNLFSQQFANFLLNPLDWYLEDLGFQFHGRYVDDFYIVHEDKRKILSAIPLIREKLTSLGVKLNEKKTQIQHYGKGIGFTGVIGVIVKPDRSYVKCGTIGKLSKSIADLNECSTAGEVEAQLATVNSYLGICGHHNTYTIRRRILNRIEPKVWKYVYVDGHYEVVKLKKKYRNFERTKERVCKTTRRGGKRRANRIP